MERRSITLNRAIRLEESIAWLSRITPQEYEMYITDNNNYELVEETKLLNELALINERRKEIINILKS